MCSRIRGLKHYMQQSMHIVAFWFSWFRWKIRNPR